MARRSKRQRRNRGSRGRLATSTPPPRSRADEGLSRQQRLVLYVMLVSFVPTAAWALYAVGAYSLPAWAAYVLAILGPSVLCITGALRFRDHQARRQEQRP